MRRFITITAIVSGFFLFFSGKPAAAQEYKVPEVTVSKETVKLEGKIYYSHVVLEKQTLYSISKAYGVSIDEIYEANRNLKETGLKKNAIILIPAKDKTVLKDEKKTAEESATTEAPVAEMPVAEEKASVKEDTAEGKKAKKAKNTGHFIHIVKWYESIDDIAEKYGISVEALMQYNSLESRKLSKRQKLRIPTEPQNYVPAGTVPETVETVPEEETAKEDSGEEQAITSKDRLDVVLMLPFNTASEKKQDGIMDFYSGALIAARELGVNGTNIELSVYDGVGSNLPITTSRLEESDFTIGPVSSTGLQVMLAKSPSDKFVISPLDHRADTLAARHGNFIQVPSSPAVQYADAIEWMKEDLAAEDKAIVFYEKGVEFPAVNSRIQRIENHETFSYNILEGRDIMEGLTPKLTETGCNRILIASESEAFVNDVIRNLNLLIHGKYNVVLYGAAKIRSFDTIDIDNLHNTNLHASMSYYIDYDNPDVMQFLMEYRALCGTEPTPFAFQGYDTMKYFGTLCSRYGDRWPDYLESEQCPMLQSDFMFRQQATVSEDGEEKKGGYVNTAVRRIVYGSDYSVTLQAATSHSQQQHQ